MKAADKCPITTFLMSFFMYIFDVMDTSINLFIVCFCTYAYMMWLDISPLLFKVVIKNKKIKKEGKTRLTLSIYHPICNAPPIFHWLMSPTDLPLGLGIAMFPFCPQK